MPAGTVTLLFTDIEGSTRFWETYPDAMRLSLARHDDLMRSAIVESGGFIFKTVGDAFCAAFSTAREAVDAAISIQMAMAAEPWPDVTPIRVRVGLHTGAVESRDRDYFGPPVNRVARLLATAHGGQSLLSRATCELVRDTLPEGVTLKDLGAHQLKDLTRPEQIFQLLHGDLESEFPPLRSLSNRPNNLPLQLTSFVGREAEIERIVASFEGSRLVTLTGSGGAGKTRLAIQVGADMLEAFPDGAWFVELAATGSEEGLARAVGKVLGVPDERDQPMMDAIAERIGDKQMILILDNCEHLIAGCARLADFLLRSCSRLKLLATSREALAISGETAFRVPPLALPERTSSHTISSLTQFAAVRLFIDRAEQVNSGFTVTNENAPAVASVCCRLDGIPLAIELAAARTRVLTVEQIEARLDQRFSLLTAGSRVALPRQQTLRALIDWSYDLLQPIEKVVLQRLAVFSGGWTLDAAESVCADESVDRWEVSESVLSLAEKSLVVTQELAGAHRYALLESIREYALEHLVASGSQSITERRHQDYFVDLAREAYTGLRASDQRSWLDRLDLDHDNFRAALRRDTAGERSLAIVGCLWWYWYSRGHLTEGRSWLDSALEKSEGADPLLRARALNGAGVLAEYQGDYAVSLAQLHEAADIFRALGEEWSLAMTLNNIGNVHGSLEEFGQAESYWRQAFEIWHRLEELGVLSDISGLAAVLDNLGNIAVIQGRQDEGREFYRQGFELRLSGGHHALAAYSLVNLGALEEKVGNRQQALEHYQRGIQISIDQGDDFAISYFVLGLASLATPPIASTLLGLHERIRSEFGIAFSRSEQQDFEALLMRLRAYLGDELEVHWNRGRGIDLQEGILLAKSVRLEAQD